MLAALRCLGAVLGALSLVKVAAIQAIPRAQVLARESLRTVYLVANDQFLSAMRDRIPAGFQVISRAHLDSQKLLDAVGQGDSLIWVGESSGLPKELWIGTFRPAVAPLSVTVAEDSPLPVGPLAFNKSTLSSAYISATSPLPYHNVVEEPRADLLPILQARDRFGEVIGYPGVLMRYYAPSLARHRFGGSDCFAFFFDQPLEALGAAGWEELFRTIGRYFASGLQMRRVQTNFASYRSGERVSVRVRVGNTRTHALCTELRFYVKGPHDKEFREMGNVRRCPERGEESEAESEFVAGGQSGLWKIRVEAREDLAHAEELAVQGDPVAVDRREIGVVVLDAPVKTRSMVSIDGPSLRLDGRDGFWAGTNYYPSSSWWDWLWRDFRPLKASEDFAAMRRAGYRIVRVWIDPVLDEQALRSMDAAIYLAAQQGIVLDICAFTQWVRWLGFQHPDGQVVSFDFRHQDFNVYGISFRNMALQKQYIQVLARRWRGAGNIIYDLSNETSVNDPDPGQMDKEAAGWQGIPATKGLLRDTLLFRRWAREMTGAIREAGGTQPVVPGYLFTSLGHGDSYLGERDGDIESWHSYASPEAVGESLSYVDPACSGRPVLLEEFGTVGWNHQKEYDGMAHFALGAGAAGAMSYEWGVSWLAPEMSFYPTPLREAADGKPDPRWFEPAISLAKSWPARSPGIFPAPSGFQYGSIYHGTPFPASAAVVLGRLGLMGQDFGRAVRPGQTYVVVPTGASGISGEMETIEATIRELWQQKVPFGVWQEDCLDQLPRSARVLIAPAAVSPRLAKKLAQFGAAGVQVFSGKDSNWQASPALARLSVMPASAEVVIRPTVEGTLYLLSGKESAPSLTLKTEHNELVTLGLSDYALVHESANGILLVEATGNVTINGSPFCRVERGRAIIRAVDGKSLSGSRRIQVMVAEPTKIQFERPIRSASVLEEGRSQPLAMFVPSANNKSAIDIDSELARYKLAIEFEGN